MEIDQHHVGAGDHALRGDVHDVEDIVRAAAAPAECDGSMHTGSRVRRCTTGTCAKSTKLRCGSPRWLFTPRRQKTILRLPPEATYSQAFSDSSRVMPMPRLKRT